MRPRGKFRAFLHSIRPRNDFYIKILITRGIYYMGLHFESFLVNAWAQVSVKDLPPENPPGRIELIATTT